MVGADAAEGETLERNSLEQGFEEIAIVVRPVGDGDDGHDDGANGVAGGGALFHGPEAVGDGGGIGFELFGDLGGLRDQERIVWPAWSRSRRFLHPRTWSEG